jgi:HK97 family phage major capsid protein
MATNISKLQERATALAGLLEENAKVEDRNADVEARQAELVAEADKVQSDLARETAIANKIAALRGAVTAAAAPVEVAEAPKPAAIAREPKKYHKLRGFESSSDAEACGRWIRGYVLGRSEDRAWYEKNVEARALSSNDNSKGGVFIPETFASTVIRLVDEYSAIPQQANVIPMSAPTLYVPRRTGGNTAYFVAENSETTNSDMTTDNVMLSAKDVRVGTRVPNSLIEDSAIDLASMVAQEFALALSKKIDDAGFAGDGTSTHGGIRGVQWKFENESLTAGVHNSSQTLVSSLTVDDFLAAVSKLPSYARNRASWYVTPQMYSLAMQSLALSSGGVTAAELMGGANVPRFLGYPVLFNNSMRTTASTDQVVALFGDLSLSTHFGLRRDVAIRASTDRYIEFDQTYFQATCRFDIVTSDVGDASTAGPVVALIL